MSVRDVAGVSHLPFEGNADVPRFKFDDAHETTNHAGLMAGNHPLPPALHNQNPIPTRSPAADHGKEPEPLASP